MNIGLSCPILWTGHVYSIISNFLFICVSYLDVYSPMFIYFLFYAYIYGLFVAVTCIFLASNSAIFCQENTSGYIGVCKNYKIIINTKSKKSEIQNQRNQKIKSKISQLQNQRYQKYKISQFCSHTKWICFYSENILKKRL